MDKDIEDALAVIHQKLLAHEQDIASGKAKHAHHEQRFADGDNVLASLRKTQLDLLHNQAENERHMHSLDYNVNVTSKSVEELKAKLDEVMDTFKEYFEGFQVIGKAALLVRNWTVKFAAFVGASYVIIEHGAKLFNKLFNLMSGNGGGHE